MTEQEREALPPLPKPDTHCWDDDIRKDVWSYSADQMHTYARAAMAAAKPSSGVSAQAPGFSSGVSEAATPAPNQGQQAAHDNAILEQGIQVGRTRERQLWEHRAATPAPAPAQAQQADCDGGTCGLGGYCDNCPATKAATPAPAPQGWKLVPVEPTPEMLRAEPPEGFEMSFQRRPEVWAAMLAAAPEAGQGKNPT